MTVKRLVLASTIASAQFWSSAYAADIATDPITPDMVPGWKFQATAYGWLTAINGDIGIRDLPPASVDISAVDVLKNLDGALMGSLLARNGDWFILGDLIWAKLSDSAHVGPVIGDVDFKMTQVIASGIVGYKLPLGLPDNVELSATAGLRYQYIKGQLGIAPADFPGISREGTEDWIDPIVGLSLRYQVDERWFVNALADIGGFGVGSDFTAQGFASVGYMWTPSISTAIGYRAIYADYENNGFVYDATQHGLFTSVGFHF